ncbi:MAG: NUDIX domain-containing protein [bacterium]
MKAEKISLESAKQDKLFYFIANVVVVRAADMRCLILKRDMREKVHPGRYGVTGGKLEWADMDITNPMRMNGDVIDFPDAVERLLARETMEEAGVKIGSKIKYINSVAFIRPDGIPCILVKFAAEYVSGEVALEKDSFTDYAWVNEAEADKYDCIEGIKDEVAAAIKAFK